jgi:hypothetical protein
VADIVVLAKDTPQVAMGQKDGARAVGSHKGGLFSEMGKGAGDHHLRPCLAVPLLTRKAVHLTRSRAEAATRKDLFQDLDPPLQFFFLMQRYVSRLTHLSQPENITGEGSRSRVYRLLPCAVFQEFLLMESPLRGSIPLLGSLKEVVTLKKLV